MKECTEECLAHAKYRYIRRYLSKYHPEIMKNIWIEGKTASELNEESLKFLPKTNENL